MNFSSSFYESQLIILAVICGVGLFIDRGLSKANTKAQSADERVENGGISKSATASLLQRKYLLVYAIVMGASRGSHTRNSS